MLLVLFTAGMGVLSCGGNFILHSQQHAVHAPQLTAHMTMRLYARAQW